MYDIDKLVLNGKFTVKYDYGVEYTGKYAFMKNYEHSQNHKFGYINREAKLNS